MTVAVGLLGLEKGRVPQEIQLDAIQIVVLDDFFDDLELVLPYLLIGEIESGGKTGMDGLSQQQFRVSLLVLTVEIDGVPTLGAVVGVVHPHGHEELDADLAAAIGHGLKVVLPLLENALQSLEVDTSKPDSRIAQNRLGRERYPRSRPSPEAVIVRRLQRR